MVRSGLTLERGLLLDVMFEQHQNRRAVGPTKVNRIAGAREVGLYRGFEINREKVMLESTGNVIGTEESFYPPSYRAPDRKVTSILLLDLDSKAKQPLQPLPHRKDSHCNPSNPVDCPRKHSHLPASV